MENGVCECLCGGGGVGLALCNRAPSIPFILPQPPLRVGAILCRYQDVDRRRCLVPELAVALCCGLSMHATRRVSAPAEVVAAVDGGSAAELRFLIIWCMIPNLVVHEKTDCVTICGYFNPTPASCPST